MRTDRALTRYILALLLRSRVVALLAAGGGLYLATALVLTELTPGTERRTFFDLAYLGLEWLAVLVPVLGSTVLQVQEFDQRTLWLVLVRPPTRGGYARARVLAVAAASWVVLGPVALGLAVLTTAMRGWPEPSFLPVVLACALESLVVAALACLWTFATTSYLTAFLVQCGTVAVGYASPLLPALAQRVPLAALKGPILALYWVAPHLAGFAVREFTVAPEGWYLAWLTGYAVCYAAVIGSVAALVASRREP